MKNYFSFLLVVVTLLTLQAQKHEIGVFFGGTNGITDIGRTDFINPLPKDNGKNESFPTLPINIGLLYKFNLNPHQSLRLNLHHTGFNDNDAVASEDYREQRGARYSQKISEASIVFEYNFFPINSVQKRAHSPYIFAGFGAFAYNKPTYVVTHFVDQGNGGPTSPITDPTAFETMISKDNELEMSYTIPFGAGYKYKFNYNWIVGLEVGVRPTFVDGIDMANAQEEDFQFLYQTDFNDYFDENIQNEVANEAGKREEQIISERYLGDHSKNDWYVFTGLTLTYTFGRPPCFCD